MRIFNKKQRGFTLVELLIYMSILAVVTILVVSTIVITMRAFGRMKVARVVDDSAKSAIERMVNEIRYASSTAGTFNTHPGSLTLSTTDRTSGLPTTIEFSYNSGALRIKEGAGSYQNLTPTNAEVTNLVFRSITASTTSKAIKIEMTIKAQNGTYEKVSNFYDTVILRQSY